MGWDASQTEGGWGSTLSFPVWMFKAQVSSSAPISSCLTLSIPSLDLRLSVARTRHVDTSVHAGEHTFHFHHSFDLLWLNSAWLVLDAISQYCPRALTFWNKQSWLMQACDSGNGIQELVFPFKLLCAWAEKRTGLFQAKRCRWVAGWALLSLHLTCRL